MVPGIGLVAVAKNVIPAMAGNRKPVVQHVATQCTLLTDLSRQNLFFNKITETNYCHYVVIWHKLSVNLRVTYFVIRLD